MPFTSIERAGRLLATAGALALAGPAQAIDLEKLVMPGPVIEGHAETEGKCAACHARLRDTDQNALCRECHKEVSADLDAGAGFHGRSSGVAEAECRSCHTEHVGRDADVVGLDAAAFDHRDTDYPLGGAHRRAPCAGCHEPAKKHREAPTDCYSCHREDDAHKGELGKQCGECHSDAGWADAGFDHDETEFPLEGKHAEVACALCHPAQRFEGTASDCNSCHRLGDVHHGRFGTKCADCHTPHGWKELRFDHARDTGFALRGPHARVSCEGCHKEGLAAEISQECVSCHRADDAHRGRNGTRCERCHSEKSWAAEKFDHGKMTEFPLRGAHAEVKCERCHTGPVEEQKLETRCAACHALDDVHAGQQGDACEQCHNETAWSHQVFFEHDVTRFPLLGMHAVAACEQCHATSRFQDAPGACWDCHAAEDKHLRRLGTDCALCHNPNGWVRWRFDHDTQTKFALHGAHEKLDCHACHRLPMQEQVVASGTCASCHARDDRHAGAFGRDCGRCHSETAWDSIDLRELR